MAILNLREELAKRAKRRKLMDWLGREPEVHRARMYHDRIAVDFRDGVRENWIHDRINKSVFNYLLPSDPFEGKDVPLRTEYFFNNLDDNAEQMSKLFLINNKQFRRGSFWSQRMIVHKLIHKLIDEGWVDIDYHHRDLTNDLKNLTGMSLKQRHFWDQRLYVYGRYSKYYPGKMLVEQFSDWTEQGRVSLKDAWRDATKLYRAIRMLIRHYHNVTRHNMLCEMNQMLDNHAVVNIGPNFICPNVYRTIFKLLDCRGYILADPYPTFGSKAIAASVEECEYYSPKRFDGLAEFLGTEFYDLDRDHYDCVLLDYQFRDPGEKLAQDLAEWEDKADIRIAFVPKYLMDAVPKPDKYIKVCTSVFRNAESDFIFYYV